MPSIRDDALCIRIWDWSETSQTVSLFTRAHGVVRGLAKGAKRERSAFSGGFEALTRGTALAIVKSNDALATLTAWDLTETFPALRRSLPAFYAGCYVAELIQHLVRDHDPHPKLFDAAVAALRTLAPPGTGPALVRFQWAGLVEAGFRPELRHDAADGGAVTDAATVAFSPRLGGVVRGSAAGGGRDRGPIWRVRRETLALLRGVSEGTPPARVSPQTVSRANRLLAAYIRELLGQELASASSAISASELAPARGRR